VSEAPGGPVPELAIIASLYFSDFGQYDESEGVFRDSDEELSGRSRSRKGIPETERGPVVEYS
jgi:hypothetical protein